MTTMMTKKRKKKKMKVIKSCGEPIQ